MRGKKFGALVLAAALTVASVKCFGLSAAAEEESAGTTVSENDPAAVTEVPENGPEDAAAASGNNLMAAGNEESTKTPLATPAGLAWDEEGTLRYVIRLTSEKAGGGWGIEVNKDGRLFDSWTIRSDQISFWTSIDHKIMESGTYTFRVKALPAADDTTHTESAWSEWSNGKGYNKTAEQLGTTIAEWDAEKAGQINFRLVAQNAEYHAYLYKDGKACDGGWQYVTSCSGKAGDIKSFDLSEGIAKYGEGKYTVKMRVMSTDLNTIAHGVEGEMSAVYDTSKNASDLSDILADAMKKTASEAVETLTARADVTEIQEAMQTSDSFRGQVEELEKKYIAEKKITAGTEVSEAAKEYVNKDNVKVVGAALNVDAGSVKLDVDVTPEDKKVFVGSGYLKNVQLDIKLVSSSKEIHELKVPVSITMPVPEGINVVQLTILHYHQDGRVESAVFHVNGDGTVTFTIKDFSTFVFAEKTAGSESSEQPNGSGQSNGSGRSGGVQNVVKDMIQSAEPMSVITITKEQKINVLSNAEMQMLVKRGDVTLVMEYVYQDKEYRIVIPAGKAEDNDILWYGPLYLAAHYSDYGISGDEAKPVVENEEGEEYIVKKGDTLGAIGRAIGMTPGQIAEKNPQIKNVDFIRVGEKIKLK